VEADHGWEEHYDRQIDRATARGESCVALFFFAFSVVQLVLYLHHQDLLVRKTGVFLVAWVSRYPTCMFRARRDEDFSRGGATVLRKSLYLNRGFSMLRKLVAIIVNCCRNIFALVD